MKCPYPLYLEHCLTLKVFSEELNTRYGTYLKEEIASDVSWARFNVDAI